MSSKAKKFEDNVEQKKKVDLHNMYGSLMGSIIVSIGKLKGKNEDSILEYFRNAQTDEDLAKSKNVREACEYIAKDLELDNEEYKKSLVLVYDEEGKYSPLVTICTTEGIYPLQPDGFYNGILSRVEEDNVTIEDIFDIGED